MTAAPSAGPRGALEIRSAYDAPSDWDAFVRGAAGGTFCHLSGWGPALRTLGHRTQFVTARAAGGELVGVLPIVSVRSRIFGHYLVSMPFLNYGGPLGTDDARAALAGWAVAEARASGADLLELRSRASAAGPGGAAAEVEAAPGLVTVDRKVTVVLPLADDPEVQWEKGLKAKLRSQVRRPMKEGLDVRFGPGEVDPFYEVFARNMRDLGTPVLPRAFFQALPAAFGDDVVFGSIYQGSVPIASGCGFRFGTEFEMTWASSLREHNAIAPNMLLYWRMMEHAIGSGVRVFNFGRCTPGGGTHKFKLQWGGTDEPLPWAVWSADGGGATPNPGQGKYALAIAAWQRLPVGVTRVLGPPIARCIP